MNLPKLATIEDFIAWEERQEQKFEFASGEVSLLPGATARHEIIVVNLVVGLRTVAEPAAVRSSGMKQLTKSSSRYADVSVTFDARDTVDLTYAKFPTLLIEVLSQSTHLVDRGIKFEEYRTIETLQEYVLVDSRKRWVQTIRRAGDTWIESLPQTAGRARFESVGLTLPLDEIYAGTGLLAPEPS